MNSIMRNRFEKVKGFVKSNKKELLQIGFMAVTVFGPALTHGICEAATSNTSMPWATGVTALKTELTGPLPTFAAIIACAVAGAMLAFGEMSGMTKKAIQVVFGIGVALGAGTFVNTISGNSSASSLLF